MKVFTWKLRAPLFTAAAVGAGFAAGAFAQDTASVPFFVNVDATVSARPGSGAAVGAVAAEIFVPGGSDAETVLRIPLAQTNGVLNGAQNRMKVPAVISNHAGQVTVNLSAQSYSNVEVSLYTVNGKRVLHSGITASNVAKKISRGNLAAGAYILSVNGAGGSAVTSRLTHSGGGLDISVSFGGGNASSATARPSAKKAEALDWTITVSAAAPGYADSVYTLRPAAGDNPQQNITLRDTVGVVIGGKRWMKKNLDVDTEESWCYNNSADSCAKYGRLYSWEAATAACPAGWHLPSRREWGDLAIAAGGTGTYGVDAQSTAGSKLKSVTGWNSYSDISSTDEFGFSALPGGSYYSGKFDGVGNQGLWWTATEYGSYGSSAYYRGMFFSYDFVTEGEGYKSGGYSVRCVYDD